MRQLIPDKQREFAVEVVRQLRDHGHLAYWAGGCVRDQLLARTPFDYDVATSARPEEIRGVFRHRKTLSIGAAFGVMTVLGPRGAGQIEVATFRQDVSYSDGRHPDRVAFSSAEEDAKRRDFTINGMFFDPLTEQIIDFVGGEADVRQGVVRAIGDPRHRFTEDKLRMLRAVRFAAVFDFRLDEATRAAMAEMAPKVTVVSAERIADEMRIVLVLPARVRAVQLMLGTGLLRAILPEAADLAQAEPIAADEMSLHPSADISTPWRTTLSLLIAIKEPTFPLSLAALLHTVAGAEIAETIGQRWRLARNESDRLEWLLKNQRGLVDAPRQRWSHLQPLLVDDGASELIQLHTAQSAIGLADLQDADFCRAQLQRPRAELDPPTLVGGDDLIALGIPRGPIFATLIKAVRQAQLDGQVLDRNAAVALAEKLWRNESR